MLINNSDILQILKESKESYNKLNPNDISSLRASLNIAVEAKKNSDIEKYQKLRKHVISVCTLVCGSGTPSPEMLHYTVGETTEYSKLLKVAMDM